MREQREIAARLFKIVIKCDAVQRERRLANGCGDRAEAGTRRICNQRPKNRNVGTARIANRQHVQTGNRC